LLENRGENMRKDNWIGTQKLDSKIQKLITEHDIVFIKFEYYTVLEEIIEILNKLGYSTNLFKAELNKYNYVYPGNLIQIKNDLIRYPNEDQYLEIDTKEKFYTVCNLWSKNRALEKSSLKIADVTTTTY
jgi:hypothetical protein